MFLYYDISKRTKDYPLYSQENKSDPIVRVKLFDPYGRATWYITEYSPDTKIAF